MSKQWQVQRRRDKYYRKAKREHYRSRSSYKLQQIDFRFDLIRTGDTIVDLGASPGGWSQVAKELAGPESKVIAMDIDRMTPIEGVAFIRGDIRKDEIVARLLEVIPDGADVVISDMAPDISGNYPYDHACSVELCEHALKFAMKVLREGGNFVVKMFYGDMSPAFVKLVKKQFDEVHVHHPKASRATSSELYVVGLDFRGRRS
ncbi:MAG: RlmE family RNA methyltransferase [Thermoplasmatota archaeon]|nr:RlmE family RNA methyltransferase [Candidatus Thermoplasmatota archaeon]MBU1914070.1 RlmE family RNA methyltransferase [Candidatus Thermoplasmatota archaeon]